MTENMSREGSGVAGQSLVDEIVSIIFSASLPEDEGGAAEKIVGMLEDSGMQVESISMRKGQVMLLVERGDERVVLWVRKNPVSQRSLEAVETILSKYFYTSRILVKTTGRADYTSPKGWIKLRTRH